MNLHIATLGKEIGHVMSSFKEFKIDKLIIITSKEFENKADEVKEKIGYFNIEAEIKIIDPFTKESYSSIIETIIKEVKQNKEENEIFINITGGTNLMSSAALTAAQYLGANAYYVIKGTKRDQFIKVPILKISLKDSLSLKQRKIFEMMYRESQKTGFIKNLNKFAEASGLYKQKLQFYLDQFQKLSLIEIDKSEREHTLKITPTGKIIKQLLEV